MRHTATLILFFCCWSWAFSAAWAQQGRLEAERCEHHHACRETKNRAMSAWGNNPRPNINYNSRSDTFDVLHYDIQVRSVNFGTNSIAANCGITLRTLLPSAVVRLDLLRLNVDSVQLLPSLALLPFTANDSMLTVQLPQSANAGDTLRLRVFYAGQPQADASWGGFYFDNGYAFNLGVGFDANPHNFGRAWHPCFDNFVERATYRIAITSTGSKRGHANGTLVGDVANGNETTRTWDLQTPIPTYLACMAVADYTTVEQSYTSALNGDTHPIELAALPADTVAFKNSFQNLSYAMAAFEYWFGAYQWEKVGFTLVPFNAGAMEHATSIAYPRYAIAGGTLSQETLMAHELSHHWWGDWLTCETAEDMWINEGMASYCEHLFLEHRYGWDKYIQEVKANHYNVLQNAHLQEGGYRPISGVPHQYTYGRHVYDKGASVAHNLRWYLGDSLYRVGNQQLMQQFSLRHINSMDMRDALTTSTGYDLTAFFDDWVFEGGFPHFEIDSIYFTPTGTDYTAHVRVRQKLVGRSRFFTEVPIELSFYGNNRQTRHSSRIVVGDELSTVTATVPFLPTRYRLNESHRLNQGRRDHAFFVAGNYNASVPYVAIPLLQISNAANTDTSHLQFEYHPVAATPSADNPNGYAVSTGRFWTVHGWWSSQITAQLRFEVDPYLDADALSAGSDSLILLYRPSPNASWQEHPNYTKLQLGSVIYLRANTLLAGDYCIGRGEMGLGVSQIERTRLRSSRIYPNPASDNVQLELNLRKRGDLRLLIVDTTGRIRHQQTIALPSAGKHIETINLQRLSDGLYFIKLQDPQTGLSIDSHTLRKGN